MANNVQDNSFLQECAFSTARLSEKCTISRLKTAITSIFSSTVSVPVEPVPRLSLYCTTWYHPEAGTAPPAPVRTSTVLLGARTGRNPAEDCHNYHDIRPITGTPRCGSIDSATMFAVCI